MNQESLLAQNQGNEEKLVIEQAFKQFSLETNRLEQAYQSLEEQFKSVQKTLQESQTRMSGKLSELEFVSRYLETILHHIAQGILFIDLSGIVTTCNETAEKILGISASNLLFHSFKEHFNDQFFGFSLDEVLKNKECPRTSFLILNKSEGIKIELEVELTFVTMDNQARSLDPKHPGTSIQGILILLRDVTEMRRLQQQANRNSRLQELGEMAAHLAHEIRNPLGGIRGFASLLYQELGDKPELRQMASQIVEGTSDLNGFVTNVLNYTKPYEAKRESTDLIKLIEELRLFMKADTAWNEKIDFVIETTLKELIVCMDPQMMKSALLNLCVNAIQAMPEGGLLKVSISQEGDRAILRIKDSGVGIPTENLDKIFSPFFTTKEKGNGLGLSEVQKVIQAHQGWMEVDSVIGKGTLFVIKLPLK
jgi:signal transduction histidine kinase